MWTFCCYDTGRAINLWHEWYAVQSDMVKAEHDTAIDYLSQNLQWRMPHAEKMSDGLIEVRMGGPVKHRLLGYYGPGRMRFTFLLACVHKQQVYTPKDALATAKKRMDAIENRTAQVVVCDRPR